MKSEKKKQQVTHQAVQKAVKQFLNDGGLIVKLPAQQNPLETVVGGEKYQNFESLANLIS